MGSGPWRSGLAEGEDAVTSDLLQVRSAVADGAALIVVAGEIDCDTANQLQQVFDDCLSRRLDTVEVDLSAVSFCDCAGLNVLLRARSRAIDAGARFRLLARSRQVSRLFALTRVSEVFESPSPPRGDIVAAP